MEASPEMAQALGGGVIAGQVSPDGIGPAEGSVLDKNDDIPSQFISTAGRPGLPVQQLMNIADFNRRQLLENKDEIETQYGTRISDDYQQPVPVRPPAPTFFPPQMWQAIFGPHRTQLTSESAEAGAAPNPMAHNGSIPFVPRPDPGNSPEAESIATGAPIRQTIREGADVDMVWAFRTLQRILSGGLLTPGAAHVHDEIRRGLNRLRNKVCE